MKFPLFNMNLFIEDLKKKNTHWWVIQIQKRTASDPCMGCTTWNMVNATFVVLGRISSYTHSHMHRKKKESYLHAELVCTPAL